MKKWLIFLISLIPCIVFAGQLKILIPFISSNGLNGLIGYSGATNGATKFVHDNVYAFLWTTTTPGNVRYAHAELCNDGTSLTLCFSLHDSSGNKLLSGSDSTSLNGTDTITIDMGSTYHINAATQYYLAIQTDPTMPVGYGITRQASGGNADYKSQAYGCGDDFSSPSDLNAYSYKMIFDNSASDPF